RAGFIIFDTYWANGNPTKYLKEYYDNGALKRHIQYNEQMGYAEYEYNFHPDGTLRSDTIQYQRGKKEGEVNYYDLETGKLSETYIYSGDSLIAIRIYKKEYEQLAMQALALQRSVQ